MFLPLVKKYIPALLLFCFSSLAFATPFSTPEEAVNAYITGVKTGSGEHVINAFISAASIQYYDDEGKFNQYKRDAFAKLVDTGNQWNADIKITDMKQTKYAANATVEFTWGAESQHGYVDYLNLIFDGSSWHISDKVAQYVAR